MNIEKTISEQAVSDILTPMLESQDRIVTEDVAPLFNKATGLDTPPASGTVTTTIEESRSVISAIIRKAWTAPLTMLGGASVIGYIAAAYTYLRNRLQGNETYGIPDRRSKISASSPLAANLALLNDRKISGVPEAADGISLVHIIGETSTAAQVTTLTDDNYGWTLNGTFAKFFDLFPNLTGLHLKCKQILFSADTGGVNASHSFSDWSLDEVETIINSGAGYNGECFKSAGRENLSLPKLKKYQTYSYGKFLISDDVVKHVDCHSLEMMAIYHSATWFADCPELLDVDFSALQDFTSNGNTTFASNCPKLWCVKIGKTTGHLAHSLSNTQNINFANCENLIRLEFTDGLDVSTNISSWSPTLDSSNLQQFLQNFREYIALRLTDNGSGLTLTLSQAVFSEIWDSQGQPQVKEDGLDDLRADIHRIIRTDKQWAVNKA